MLSAAIEEVRKVARDIVKRAEGSASVAAAIVAEVKLAKLDAARFAVLDLTSDDAPTPDSIGTAPAPAVDFAPVDAPAAYVNPDGVPALEFGSVADFETAAGAGVPISLSGFAVALRAEGV